MAIETQQAPKRTYQRPEMQVVVLELGVFGNYGDAEDPPKPLPGFGFGNSAG